MGTQVNNFKRYFGASAKGDIPFQPGFTIVGKVGNGRPQSQRSNLAPPADGIVSISPAIAAEEQATTLVGGGRRSKTKRKVVKRAGGNKKRTRKKYRKPSKKPKSKKKTKPTSGKIHRKEAL